MKALDLRGVLLEVGDIVCASKAVRLGIGKVTSVGRLVEVDFGEHRPQKYCPHSLLVLPQYYLESLSDANS